MDVGERLQSIRKLKGLSQRELAKRAGVTNSTISMIEKNSVSPSISSLKKVLAGIPMARAADADEIADLALFLCSGAARYIHGTVIAIDGGQTNLGSLPFGNALLESLKPSPS